MPRCSVLMCKNDSRSVNVSNGGVSYHRFPKDPNIKEKWIDSTGRANWFPKLSNTICSEHFDPKDILLTKKGYKYLSDAAVPTRNFLSYHVRTPSAETKPKLISDEVEIELPLKHLKVEATPGPFRKRESGSSTESNPAKVQKKTTSDDDSDVSDEEYEKLSTKEKELDSMLRYEQNKYNKQRIKMNRLQKKLKRLKMTITNMDDLYTALEDKFHILTEDIMSLRSIDVTVSELVARRQTNKELSEVVSKLTYSSELRSFALTLHFISAKAYDFVRKVFKTSLPHPRTLKHWYLKVNGDPGFTKEAFVALKHKTEASKNPILATLVVHKMYMNRCVEVDVNLYGYVDTGTGLEGDMLDEAKEVLALSVTAINGHFKVPVGYFLTCNVTSEQRAGLVKMGIEMAHDAGIQVVALSFESSPDNMYMAGHLGCNFEKGQVAFDHPVTYEPIVAILDPSHLLQCLRDTLRDFETLLDKDGNTIQWKFFKKLNGTLYLSKKLKDQYVDFQNARVKVKLSSELFSTRIADALQYCRKDLELGDYKESEPTQMFVTLCSTAYEVFNSINSHVYGYKNALNKNNADQIFEFLNMVSEYITNLKVKKGCPVNPVMRSHKKYTLFIAGIKELYTSFVKTGILKSLPLYKLSHDHLKLIFWNIKVDAGCKIGKDPTPKKVIFAYKKVVEQIKAYKGKNPPLERTSIPFSPSPVDRINRIAGQDLTREDKIEDDPELDETLEVLSNNNEVAVVQIAGYIVQQLIKKIHCDVCVEALVTKNRAINNFIIAKDKTRLLYPSLDAVKVCKTAEMFLKGLDGRKSKQMVKCDITMTKIMRQFVDSKIFDDISYHQVGEFPESNHVTDLVKAIVERYARIHYKIKIKRETYKDVVAQLKEMWSLPITAPRYRSTSSINFSFEW